MQKLVQGIHQFQDDIFSSQRELFERLADGQNPEALFITCSDSRINPNLLTQTDPGELFILRNAGNIIPPYGAAGGGEAATIEYAVSVLGVQDIIVCGHSHCGAMNGAAATRKPDGPAGGRCLAGACRGDAADREGELPPTWPGAPLLATAIEENVLVQLENLRTHPAVAAAWRAAS